MSGERILIVEDDARIAALLVDYAASAGYRAEHVDRGDLAMERIRHEPPDLLLLDLMLPGLDGLTVCRQVRAEYDLPIIMITARVEEIDRLLGLELGADDYVCKPFSPREVMARAKAVLRRAGRGAAQLNPLQVDRQGLAMRVDGRALPLTPTEFHILAKLVETPGRVYSRDQLMDAAYSDHRIVGDRTIDAHVRNIRRKLADVLPDRDLIVSIYGVGYKFEA